MLPVCCWARATSRQKEMALRAALGAARGRGRASAFSRESVTLALAGGALGIALALLGFSILKTALPVSMAGWSDIPIDWHVLVFAIALSVLTGFGVWTRSGHQRFHTGSGRSH